MHLLDTPSNTVAPPQTDAALYAHRATIKLTLYHSSTVNSFIIIFIILLFFSQLSYPHIACKESHCIFALHLHG